MSSASDDENQPQLHNADADGDEADVGAVEEVDADDLLMDGDDVGGDDADDGVEVANDGDDAAAVEGEPPAAEEVVDPNAALKTRDLQAIFKLWSATHTQHGFDPMPILTR